MIADDEYAYLGKEDKVSGKFGVTRYHRITGEYAGFPGGIGEEIATINIGAQPAGLTIKKKLNGKFFTSLQ